MRSWLLVLRPNCTASRHSAGIVVSLLHGDMSRNRCRSRHKGGRWRLGYTGSKLGLVGLVDLVGRFRALQRHAVLVENDADGAIPDAGLPAGDDEEHEMGDACTGRLAGLVRFSSVLILQSGLT